MHRESEWENIPVGELKRGEESKHLLYDGGDGDGD
jgi:hypothetical protein